MQSSKVSNSNNTIPHIRSKKSLKATIKMINTNFVKKLASEAPSRSSKFNLHKIVLAKIYLEGKRVAKNIAKANEILDDTTTTQAKYLLMQTAVKLGKYSDAFHYYQFLRN